MPLYYIAIIIPEPLQSEITAFKNDIYERFGAKYNAPRQTVYEYLAAKF